VRKTRFKEEQIIRILREAEANSTTAVEVCRQQGISEQTFYRWKRRYGGMEVSDARRLRELELENQRLKRLLAERDLAIEVMKEIQQKKW
jgi:putative transposase